MKHGDYIVTIPDSHRDNFFGFRDVIVRYDGTVGAGEDAWGYFISYLYFREKYNTWHRASGGLYLVKHFYTVKIVKLEEYIVEHFEEFL